MSELLKDHLSKLRFNRVLAWGDNGLVALFDIGASGRLKQVVVKCGLNPSKDSPLQREKGCHRCTPCLVTRSTRLIND